MFDRNRLLSEKWYQLYIERLHLLVPQAKKSCAREVVIGDVVLFTFQDPGIPKMWVWKLGIITKKISRSTFEVRYVSKLGSPPRLIQRDLRHICIVHGLDEIPPMSTEFFKA